MKIIGAAKTTMNKRLFYEKKYSRGGDYLVIGTDEAGRGPLAGPVVAGAVALLDFNFCDDILQRLLEEVDDSKKLTAAKRSDLYAALTSHKKIAWSCAKVSPKAIDKINILEASKLAMENAVYSLVRNLGEYPEDKIFCLIDGNFPIKIPYRQKSIIGGDAKVFSIAAASIIAKVTRDRIMEGLARRYPGYGFERHKGYPTREHLAALDRLGLLSIHRLSFGPCADLRRKAIIKS